MEHPISPSLVDAIRLLERHAEETAALLERLRRVTTPDPTPLTRRIQEVADGSRTAREIATLLGVRPAVVAGSVSKMRKAGREIKIKPGQPPKIDAHLIEAACNLIQSGVPVVEAAKQVGLVSDGQAFHLTGVGHALRRRYRELGLAPTPAKTRRGHRRSALDPRLLDQACQLVAQGVRPLQAAVDAGFDIDRSKTFTATTLGQAMRRRCDKLGIQFWQRPRAKAG